MTPSPGGIDTVYANLNGATDYVYEIFSTTNLATVPAVSNWDIETEVFPGSNTNIMPFSVSMNGRPNLFLWARDWTGIKENGNTVPDWWFYNWFGTVDLLDSNMDSFGVNTLLYDYQNKQDPNIIVFYPQFPSVVHTNIASGSLAINSGIPFYIATLVNDANTADAVWQPYTGTNVTASLGSSNGVYTLSVGLRGLPTNATTAWISTQVILEAFTPTLIITNPASSIVAQPMVQLQGLVNETLSSLTYDVSNSLGVIANQPGYWNASFFDTNVDDFTTNNFQCYDIPLTNGLNVITLRATDLQGNTVTTNVSVTLDYSSITNPPNLSILWPQNETLITAGNFTLQAQVDDDTATITAQITDNNGDTNTASGVVERSGKVWVNNIPLATGTNILTVTATNAAGHGMTTNLTIIQSQVTVTVDPLAQPNSSYVTVTGTISDPNATVIVNGTNANILDDEGDWEAQNVPVNPTGTATVDVEAYGTNSAWEGSQNVPQTQPPVLTLMSYSKSYYDYNINFNACINGGSAPWTVNDIVHWLHSSGGLDSYQAEGISDCIPGNENTVNSLTGGYNGYLPDSGWEIKNVSQCSSTSPNWVTVLFGPPYTSRDVPQYEVDNSSAVVNSRVGIFDGGPTVVGQKKLYLVSAQVIDENTGLQLPGSSLQFQNQVPGTPVIDVTNGDGLVWSQFLVIGPGGTNPVVVAPEGENISFDSWQATNVTLQIIDANTGTNLTMQANPVIVGQQMNLTCQLNVTNAGLGLMNSNLNNFQWTVPGDAISNYWVAPDTSSAMVITNFPLNNTNVAFYWVDGANSRAVQVSATVNGMLVTGQAVFNITRPIPQFYAQVVGTIAADTNFHYSAYSDVDGSIVDEGLQGGPYLHFGVASSWTNVGITFAFSNASVNVFTSPTYGKYFLVQTVDYSDFKMNVFSNDNIIGLEKTPYGLDTEYPYDSAGDFWHIGGYSARTNDMWCDAPGASLGDATWLSRTDSFTMYLMFVSSVGNNASNNIPVPIYSATWSWAGTATNNYVFGNSPPFVLTSSSLPSPVVSPTLNFPVWTVNVTNFVFQTNATPFQ